MRLTNVVPSDIEWIDQVVDGWDCSNRWSLHARGLTPSPTVLGVLLWGDVMVQQVVRSEVGSAAAVFQLTNVNLLNGIAELALLADPQEAPRLADPLAAFLARVFRDFPLRKVGFATVTGDLDVSTYFRTAAQLVSRLPQHLRRGGGIYADLEVYDIWAGAVQEVATTGGVVA